MIRPGESGRVMPIMLSADLSLRARRGERFVRAHDVPWELFGEAGERTSRRNHDQSLDTIARRGGFDAVECICVLTGMEWQQGKDIGEEQAHRILYMMAALYRRGVLAGRRALTAETTEPSGVPPGGREP